MPRKEAWDEEAGLRPEASFTFAASSTEACGKIQRSPRGLAEEIVRDCERNIIAA